MSDQTNFEKWLRSPEGRAALAKDPTTAMRMAYEAGQKQAYDLLKDAGMTPAEYAAAQITSIHNQGLMSDDEFKDEMAVLERQEKDENDG